MEARGSCSSHANRRAERLVERWQRREGAARQQVAVLLAEIGFDFDFLVAQAIFEDLADLERLETMIHRVEVRRTAALRELSQWDARVGATVRRRAGLVIDMNAPLA